MDGRSRYQSPRVRYALLSVQWTRWPGNLLSHTWLELYLSSASPVRQHGSTGTWAPPPQCKLWKLRLKLPALCVAQSVTVNSPSGVRPTSANLSSRFNLHLLDLTARVYITSKQFETIKDLRDSTLGSSDTSISAHRSLTTAHHGASRPRCQKCWQDEL